MTKMRSVYIHIPFCKSICSYCDFCKVFYYEKWAHEYLLRLKDEIEDFYQNDEIKSIYIGGGTPSALSLKEIEFLLELTKKLKKSLNLEFTFECNLDDINEDFLKILKQYQVNRLSIGIQTFQKHLLKLLGRNHTYEDAFEKMKLIRSFGFHNVNLDLIYAIPSETKKDLMNDLKLFLKLKPDHISTYSLMIEPHTLLFSKSIKPIDECIDSEMYKIIYKFLKKKKYVHYEISNFALLNRESIHNLTYWNNEEYYGFGVSASGYLENIRYTNTKNLLKYLKGNIDPVREILSKQDIMDNEMMVGLRKRKGICVQEFQEKYHVILEDVYPIKPLLKNGDLKLKNGYLFIPFEKVYVSNEILLKMI